MFKPPPRVPKPPPPEIPKLPTSMRKGRMYFLITITAVVMGLLAFGLGLIGIKGLGLFFRLRDRLTLIVPIIFGVVGMLVGINSARIIIHLAAKAGEEKDVEVS